MKVYIHNLKFKTIIGILPFERVKKQKVIVDISFKYDFVQKTTNFIDYSEISFLIKKTMQKRKFKLIEDAIVTLEKKIYKKYNLSDLYIQISKPDILKNCSVSVSN